jgi:hypothetical protein
MTCTTLERRGGGRQLGRGSSLGHETVIRIVGSAPAGSRARHHARRERLTVGAEGPVKRRLIRELTLLLTLLLRLVFERREPQVQLFRRHILDFAPFGDHGPCRSSRRRGAGAGVQRRRGEGWGAPAGGGGTADSRTFSFLLCYIRFYRRKSEYTPQEAGLGGGVSSPHLLPS